MEGNPNVFKFQGSKMIVSGKGPNFSMNLSFRPNMQSSFMPHMIMPRNIEKQSSEASLASSQRSIDHGIDSSTTARIRRDLQLGNTHQAFSSYYSQISGNNDGAVAPVSMRSIDSTDSRVDIFIDSLQSFTEDELEKIWQAVKRKRALRKPQKRRNQKIIKTRPDDESKQGSHSSVSNDGCAPTQAGNSRRYRFEPYCKENVPRCVNSFDFSSVNMFRSSNKDAYSDYPRSDLRNPYLIDSSAGCPANILPYQKQQQCGSMYFSESNALAQNESMLNSQNNTSSSSSSLFSNKGMQNMPRMSLRDRFRGGFQFQSQRFNRTALHEEQEPVGNKQFQKKDDARQEKLHLDQINEQSSEDYDIFLDTKVKLKTATDKDKKRKFGDIPNSNIISNKQTQNKDNNENNEFKSVKPQFPVGMSVPAKPREKITSTSTGAPDLFCSTEDKNLQPQLVQAPSPEPDLEPEQTENSKSKPEETYTDEEIFKVCNGEPKRKPQKKAVTKKSKQDEKNKVANKPQSKKKDYNANPIKNKNEDVGINTKDVCNTKTSNNKNMKDIGETKPTNNKSRKDVGDTKLANNNVKEVGNMKPTKTKNIKENVKDPVKQVLPAAPKIDTPIKSYPMHNHIANPNENGSDTQLSTEVNKTNSNPVLSPVVVSQVVDKAPKKQTIKTKANKTQPKTMKSNDKLQPEITAMRTRKQAKLAAINSNPVLSPVVVSQVVDKAPKKQTIKTKANKTQPKTMKSNDKLQPEITAMRTRQQAKLAAMLESVKNSVVPDKDKEKTSSITVQRKRKAEKKGTQD